MENENIIFETKFHYNESFEKDKLKGIIFYDKVEKHYFVKVRNVVFDNYFLEGTYVYDNIFGLKKDKIFLEKEYDEKSIIIPLIFIYFLQWDDEKCR